jgi:hypothetical protein
MELDPILSALSKLKQSINNRYNDLNDKYQLVHTQLDALNVKLDNYPDKIQKVNTKLERFNNKITILDEKVDSILSIANDLHTPSPTINVAVQENPVKTKWFPFESMLESWQSYCKDNNTTIIPKTETKLSGWVRDTWKAYKQYINNEPSTMTKEREELLKAANFPFNYLTSTNHPSENSEKKAKDTPTKQETKNTQKIIMEKEVGKNPNPTTTPSTRSSTIKKDTTTTKTTEYKNSESMSTEMKTTESNKTKSKNTESKTIVLLKQLGKKSITPPTKSIASIANDKKLSEKI